MKQDEQSMYEIGVKTGLAWNDLVRLFGAVAHGFSDTIADRPTKRFTLRERIMNAVVAFRIKEA
ncbi:MAG: hypothetical protein WC565_09925 [Parcubacteria group bacterium]|jgi:hypothetical protein